MAFVYGVCIERMMEVFGAIWRRWRDAGGCLICGAYEFFAYFIPICSEASQLSVVTIGVSGVLGLLDVSKNSGLLVSLFNTLFLEHCSPAFWTAKQVFKLRSANLGVWRPFKLLPCLLVLFPSAQLLVSRNVRRYVPRSQSKPINRLSLSHNIHGFDSD